MIMVAYLKCVLTISICLRTWFQSSGFPVVVAVYMASEIPGNNELP